MLRRIQNAIILRMSLQLQLSDLQIMTETVCTESKHIMMSTLPVLMEKPFLPLTQTEMSFRTDIQNCIQFFAQDKCAFIAGYYGVISMVKRNLQYFFPAFSKYREITSFAVDEAADCIVFFMSQKLNDLIYFTFRYINKTY